MNSPEIFNPFGCNVMIHQTPDIIMKALNDEVDSVRSQLGDKEFVNQNNFAEYLAGKNSYQIKIDPSYLQKTDIESYILSLARYYIDNSGSPWPYQNIKLGSVWINYAYKGDFNPIHTHDALLSGFFCISASEGIMEEQRQGSTGRASSGIPGMTHLVHNLENKPFNKFSYSSEFKPGKVIMFPSWLTHWVNPFETDGERVTVAYNVLEQ